MTFPFPIRIHNNHWHLTHITKAVSRWSVLCAMWSVWHDVLCLGMPAVETPKSTSWTTHQCSNISLCYIMLCYVVLCYVMLQYVMLQLLLCIVSCLHRTYMYMSKMLDYTCSHLYYAKINGFTRRVAICKFVVLVWVPVLIKPLLLLCSCMI